MPEKNHSPAMAQYHRWKKEHPDEILFFQMGDFFEMFYDDAKLVSQELGLALTSRSKGADAIPMAGVPLKSADLYLKKLVTKGFRVAICDQIEDPKETTGVVDRAVTRIVTAGTLTEEDLLDRGAPNYLGAVHMDNGRCGLALVDLSTGDFVVSDVPADEVVDTLSRHGPVEVLHSEDSTEDELSRLDRTLSTPLTSRPGWQFEKGAATEAILEQFRVTSLDGFGIDEESPTVVAAGAALRYLEETQKTRLDHLNPPRVEAARDRLILDRATRSCLELTETARDGRREGSLLSVLDETVTAMGARELRSWLLSPLREVGAIHRRQAAVEELIQERSLSTRVGELLRSISDIERLLTRVVTNRANARDLVSLRESLGVIPGLKTTLEDTQSEALQNIAARLDPQTDLTTELGRALIDTPPLTIHEGGIIRDGYNAELDELRAVDRDGRQFILGYQNEEIERTGITNLKVGFNRVFGFYIEVTNSFKNRVPEDYIRKQTLKNAERYITPRLKEYESKVLTAEERTKKIEFDLFQEVRQQVTARLENLKILSAAIAELDTLRSLAEIASLHGYVRPQVDDGEQLDIKDGRHPVLAATMGASVFVPNDCRLDQEASRLAIVTGPNMSGKSTYIRQVALIQILAQMGSFVPAQKASVSVCDRVFARVGASDDLARGNSTFMVEMTETANILNNATRDSLVILDEVGRGTSTFDGLAIAWAISEYLVQKIQCRGLFATHYHQLIELNETCSGVSNLNVAVREWGEEIVFMHQIVEGGSDRSYGIHVARIAGVPKDALARAQEILRDLEKNHPHLRPSQADSTDTNTVPRKSQESLFESPEKSICQDIRAVDPDTLAPVDALLKIREWRDRLS